jgi:vanadium chloroperoxidase
MHDAYFWQHLASGGARPNPDYPLFYSYTLNTAYDATQREAVVAGSAYAALMALYPAFGDLFTLGKDLFRPGMEAPFDLGVQIGNEVIQKRSNDRSAEASGGVKKRGNRYDHREDPTNLGQGLLHPRWGEVLPFAVTYCHPLDDPPLPSSTIYESDLREVFIKGSRTPPVRPKSETFKDDDRTPDETVIALYWGYDGASGIGTPPRLYNQIAHTLIQAQAVNTATALPESDVVRLLMFVNVAMADAGIAAWYHKYRVQLWRPILGIREYDASTGPIHVGQPAHEKLDALADPFWIPFGARRTNQMGPEARPFTPNFPSYPSGHATFGGAFFEALRLFFKVSKSSADSIGFSMVSDELNGTSMDSETGQRIRHVRKFSSLLEAMYENSVSRIFNGVHWRFDGLVGKKAADILSAKKMIGGVPLGRSIAQDIFDHGIKSSPTGASCSLDPVLLASFEHTGLTDQEKSSGS